LRIFVTTLLLSLTTTCALAFDAQHALEIAKKLSSDEFAGRRSGHPGGRKAEEFIADYCRKLGLEPAGQDSYFQEVPMLVTEEQTAVLAITGSELGKIPFVQGLDFTLATHSGSGYFTDDIVVAGFGIVSEEKGRDDFGDLDVRDKVVVIVRGEPKNAYSFDDERTRTNVLKNAKVRGAAAVMWFMDGVPVNGAAISEEIYDPELPLLFIGDRVMHVILENSGYSISSYKEAIKTAPAPLATKKQASINVKVKRNQGKAGRNVLAMVLGNDPVLKNELIVVGAHLDHCGTNANGIIYNGAGDNATGSGLIAELANSIKSGLPLKRTVVFIWFTGEEDGLLGSEYFVEHPTLPFGNIVAMLNFDMVGQGDGGATIVGLEMLGEVGFSYADSLRQLKQGPKVRASRGGAHSDYAPFIESGAPGIAFWASGEHPFYHHFADDAQWLNLNSFETVGSNAEALIRYLAAQSATLASRSDTVEVLARHATTLDIDGFFVDATGTVAASNAMQVAWLPYDPKTSIDLIVKSCSYLHAYCKKQDIASASFKEAVSASSSLKRGVALAIPEVGLSKRPPQDVLTMTKLGLALVNLSPGADAQKLAMTDETFDILHDAGVYALISLDYNAASRVQRWGKQSIVSASLAQFAKSPDDIRVPLLTSDALLVLDVDAVPTAEELETIRAGRQRYVHLNFGESFDDMREGDQEAAIKILMAKGFTQDDVLLLLNKNLQRFLDSQ
jgi:aminopeptidase YwaD